MPPKQDRPLTSGIATALRVVANAIASLPTPGMIIGGIAVILHGVPRLTRDIDATVSGSGLDLDTLLVALKGHGIAPRIADAVAFARTSQVLLLRHEPTGVDVDLSLAWLPFELAAIAARQHVSQGSIDVDVARPEDLIIYKAVAWRPQDQQDIERLLTLHAAKMDLPRVLAIVAELAEAIDEPDRLAQLQAVITRAVRP